MICSGLFCGDRKWSVSQGDFAVDAIVHDRCDILNDLGHYSVPEEIPVFDPAPKVPEVLLFQGFFHPEESAGADMRRIFAWFHVFILEKWSRPCV
jgi:hypothetical protein